MAFTFNPFTGNFDTIIKDATAILYGRLDASKKNIAAASDNVELALNNLDDAIGALASSPTNYTPSDAAIVADHLGGIDNALGNILSTINNFEFRNSVLDKDLTAPPGSPTTGDRYLIGLDTGATVATGAWAGEDGHIAEWDGSAWQFATPNVGWFIGADDEPDLLYLFGGVVWAPKNFEATTASGFLSKTGFDIQLTDLNSQNIIAGNGSNVATSVDTNSVGDVLVNTATGLTIKAGVIVNADISATAAIAYSKLAALTTNRALVSNASGFVSVSAVTDTELAFLSGVTSNVQTQLNGKVDEVSSTDNAVTRFDGTTGSIQNSGVIVDDSNGVSGIASLTIGATTAVNGILDEDNMSSDSASSLATQQSIKAYTDNSHFSVNSVSTATSAAANETYLVDTSGGAVTVTLPAPAANAFVRIKDAGGSANTNNITVAPNAAEQIDNVAGNFTMDSDLGANVFVSDGTNWFVF